jgi:catechol 2,3-dioxygenase-like lactoylglutathione lyase family enzyme
MRLNQATLPAPDMAKSRAFWEALGFEVIVDSAPRYMRFLAPDGVSTVSLHAAAAAASGGAQIYLECDGLDETCARLAANGVSFVSGPKDQDWLWREAWLVDPGGTEICLFHAGENRIDPPWRLRRNDC